MARWHGSQVIPVRCRAVRRHGRTLGASMGATTGRRLAILLAVLIALGAGLVGWTSGGFTLGADAQSTQKLAPRPTSNGFDSGRAFALLRDQVQDYGHRPAGSPASRRLARRLRALLPRGRSEQIPGHPGLRNVVGSIPGRGRAIVIGAHYDVEAAPAGFVGANDGAAGTAAVVYLARALARAPRPRGARAVRFVLFDGEEEPAGCEPFIECGLRFARELSSDEALWAKLRSAARAVGVGSLFPPTAAAGEVLDDHTPFTQRGIPAIDLIDFGYPPRDSLQDTLDKVSQRSLDAVGETVLRLVLRLRRVGAQAAR